MASKVPHKAVGNQIHAALEAVLSSANNARHCGTNMTSMGSSKYSSSPDMMQCALPRYGPTYLVLDLLQKIFYTSDAARESFVELCEEEFLFGC